MSRAYNQRELHYGLAALRAAQTCLSRALTRHGHDELLELLVRRALRGAAGAERDVVEALDMTRVRRAKRRRAA